MNKLIKLVIVVVIVAGSLVYLLTANFSSFSLSSVEVSDILSEPDKYMKKGAEIRGKVVAGSINKNGDFVVFKVKDVYDNNTMKVAFSGYIPSAFTDNATVILKGTYDEKSSIFNARSLVAQCPSRYEGMDIKEHDKAMADNAKS